MTSEEIQKYYSRIKDNERKRIEIQEKMNREISSISNSIYSDRKMLYMNLFEDNENIIDLRNDPVVYEPDYDYPIVITAMKRTGISISRWIYKNTFSIPREVDLNEFAYNALFEHFLHIGNGYDKSGSLTDTEREKISKELPRTRTMIYDLSTVRGNDAVYYVKVFKDGSGIKTKKLTVSSFSPFPTDGYFTIDFEESISPIYIPQNHRYAKSLKFGSSKESDEYIFLTLKEYKKFCMKNT